MSNILNSLSKLLQDKHDIWNIYLPFVQYVYNTTPCLDSTSYSPYFLNHGCYSRMPIHMQLSQIIDLPNTANKCVEHLVKQLQFENTAAESIMLERKQHMQEQSQLHMRDPHFNVGDVVYIYDPVITSGNSIKLSRLWVGPYYVVEKPSAIHVKLRRVHDNKLIHNKVHVNKLKRGCLRSGLFDMQPPHNVDASESAILDVSELSPQDVNNIIHDNNVSNNVHEEINDISNICIK